MIANLYMETAKFGLQMNIDNAKILANYDLATEINIGYHSIQSMQKYAYLGQVISHADSQTKEVNTKITKASKDSVNGPWRGVYFS